MIIAVLVILGLAFGSFVNALVWRVHEQEKLEVKKGAKKANKHDSKLSILKGRSMCPNCKHELGALDLLPVISWLALRGKCRYCKKAISAQYPIVELATALVFVVSYLVWPIEINGSVVQIIYFGLWLTMVVGLMALLVYDLRWMILPDRIVFPLGFVAAAMSIISVATADRPLASLISVALSVAVGGGLFYVLFQVSDGKWIGGGDVKLGWVIGLFLATPARSFLMIFVAALLGSLVSLPLLASHTLKRSSTIPFGPFLIISSMVVMLYGKDVLDWYQSTFLPFTT